MGHLEGFQVKVKHMQFLKVILCMLYGRRIEFNLLERVAEEHSVPILSPKGVA